jgi:phosphoribosyl 1,2-cyclic phosphate phosphodiesterase
MSDTARITLLGTGTSTGVPVIGCRCAVCTSDDPRNKRTRTSLFVTLPSGDNVLFDTAPELRLQAVRAGLSRIAAVVYTHLHADHCHGFDDLRAFAFHAGGSIPCYLPRAYEAEFRRRFAYALEETGYAGAKPQVDLRVFDEAPFAVAGVTLEPTMVPHGAFKTAVFRLGAFVYATDFKVLPDALIERWRGRLHTMVASGLHYSPHPTHSTLPETLALLQKLEVKRGIITHMSHEIEHARDGAKLPPDIELGYDGMSVDAPLTLP